MNLNELISKDYLYSVFQPIVSLNTTEVTGYEALTRIAYPYSEKISIEQLFIFAEKNNMLWDLEKLTRKLALKAAKNMQFQNNLFINVNPSVLNDENFKNGFTLQHLEKYKMNCDKIVFEITERTATPDIKVFKETINHYRKQGFRIAIDDLGAGYSDLNLVCNLDPDFIKIDMKLIRNINQDSLKQSVVKSLVDYSDSSGTVLIAEGVETEAELRTLLELKVSYVQGFLTGKPSQTFEKPFSSICSKIISYQNKDKLKAMNDSKKNLTEKDNSQILQKKSFLQYSQSGNSRLISSICQKGVTFPPKTSAQDILNCFYEFPDCFAITLVDSENNISGYISRAYLMSRMGGQFGFSLNGKKEIQNIREKEFLIFKHDEPVESAALKAMTRTDEQLYAPVPVKDKNGYMGIVTIKNLLDSIVSVEVNERTLEIKKKNRMLLEQRKIAERDLIMAERVQKSFYQNKAPITDLWDCAFIFRPMSSVSGDVYDFYYDENKNLTGVSLLDVSGHGIASALVGILAKSLAQQAFVSNKNKILNKVMSALDKSLAEEKGAVENYLTGVMIRINDDSLEYANAGHTEVLKKNGQIVTILGEKNGNYRGSFLGIPDFPSEFSSVEISMQKGDTFLVYTDCLIESRNLAGDELGIDLLKKIFLKTKENKAKDILKSLIESFDAFTEAVPVRDDLTVIVLKYKG